MKRKTLTVQEAAQALGISTPRVYELCKRADFPAVRISPHRIIIPAASFEAWLERAAQDKA